VTTRPPARPAARRSAGGVEASSDGAGSSVVDGGHGPAVAAALKAGRAERGWSLDEVAERLRIPIAYLEALEEWRPDDLPDEPYRGAYQRAYAELLGIRLSAPPRVAARPPGLVPMWVVRVLASLLLVALVVLVGVQVDLWWRDRDEIAARLAPTPGPPDQRVRFEARAPMEVRWEVDGVAAPARALSRGDVLDLVAHDTILLVIPGAANTVIEYNGAPIAPSGDQRGERRLVFIDDVGGGPR
jgi:hypothetical protein